MATRKKSAPKKSAAKKAAPRKPTPKKAPAKKPAPRKAAAAKDPATPAAAPATRRADFGAPIDGVIAKQPDHLREILEALRALAELAAPDATAALKWGMPTFSIGTRMMCVFGAHKAHVNLVLVGPLGAFPDPEGRLEGSSDGGRHLKLTALADLPRQSVRNWLQIAARHARSTP